MVLLQFCMFGKTDVFFSGLSKTCCENLGSAKMTKTMLTECPTAPLAANFYFLLKFVYDN